MKFLLSCLPLLFFCHMCVAQAVEDVVVLPVQISAPPGAEKLGSLSAGNNSTKTNCDYEALIKTVKEKARAMHGNLVKITEMKEPAFIGKCYKIKADVFRVNDIAPYKPAKAPEEKPAATVKNYATLYLYRLKDTLALITSYNVHMGRDSVIFAARKRSRDSVKLYKEGPFTLWADIETRTELKLNVKLGETYYVRCGLVKGEIRMNPVLELVDNTLGADQYAHITKASRNPDVKYLREIH